MWLLSKHREESALESLRWMRGWVPQNVVQNEFDSMKRHKQYSNACDDCKKAAIKCTHHNVQTMSQTFKELLHRRTTKPFTILMTIAVVSFYSGSHHLAPYMAQLLNTYRSPISPNVATVRHFTALFSLFLFYLFLTILYVFCQIIVSGTGLAGTFAGIFGIKMWGKRKSYLIALLGVIISAFTLCELM